jgi:inorganic pyrophosphatase
VTRSLVELPPFADDGEHVHVVVETPKYARSKFVFDEALGCITWSAPLPAGLAFPFDFGFVPRTRADDGDPIDLVLLHDEPTFPGCVVEARLLGALRAVQRRGRGPRVRNDRLLAVPSGDRRYDRVRSVRDVDRRLLTDLEAFFVAFGVARGKQVVFDGCVGAPAALRLVRAAMGRFERERGGE